MDINTNKATRMEHIDFLKGIAIFMVVLVHFTARIPQLNVAISLIGAFGQMGCQLFFVISAYLTMTSFKVSKKGFIIKRFSRLLPEYYLAMLLHIPLIIILRDILMIDMNFPRTDIFNIVANIFFLQRIGGIAGTNDLVTGSWYVFVVLVFYIFIYIIVVNEFINKNNIDLWLIGSVLCTFLSGIVKYAVNGIIITNNDYFYSSIFVQLSVLLIGVKYYYLCEENKQYNKKQITTICLVVLVLSFIMFSSKIEVFLLIVPFMCGVVSYGALDLMKNNNYIESNGLLSKIMKLMGKYSYEIFFMHIYPASYGVRVIRVVLEKMHLQMNGTILFFVLIIPVYIASIIMAILFRKVYEMIKGMILNVLLLGRS